MKKLFFIAIMITFLAAGCAELANIGKSMQNAGTAAKKVTDVVGPIANAFFPGSEIILAGITGLLTIGGGALYRLSSKRLTATQATIKGVAWALENKADLKTAISTIATTLNVEEYLNKLVQKYDPPKLTTPT